MNYQAARSFRWPFGLVCEAAVRTVPYGLVFFREDVLG